MLWPEKEIYEGIRKGDNIIFNAVFKEYYAGLSTYAKDFVKSNDTAQEIVQEVFFSLWENHQKIYIKDSLKAYLYRCVHNLCLNFLRNHHTFAKNNITFENLEQSADLLFSEMPDDIFETAFAEQMETELEKTIENLPEQCKTIFRLCRFEHLPYPEIAQKLNLSISTVKTQMSRAMDKLRIAIDEYYKNK